MEDQQTDSPRKQPPAWLKALGHDDLPEGVECAGRQHRRVAVFKHDFFAATGLYEGPSGRAVLKVGRVQSMFGLPLRWILASRQVRSPYRVWIFAVCLAAIFDTVDWCLAARLFRSDV